MKQNIGEIDRTVEDIRDGNRKEGSKSLWRCGVLSAATYVPWGIKDEEEETFSTKAEVFCGGLPEAVLLIHVLVCGRHS